MIADLLVLLAYSAVGLAVVWSRRRIKKSGEKEHGTGSECEARRGKEFIAFGIMERCRLCERAYSKETPLPVRIHKWGSCDVEVD